MSLDRFGHYSNKVEYSKHFKKGVEKFQVLFNDSSDGNLNAQKKIFKNCLAPINENDLTSKLYVDEELKKVIRNITNSIHNKQRQQKYQKKELLLEIEKNTIEFNKRISNLETVVKKRIEELDGIEEDFFNYISFKTTLKGETQSIERGKTFYASPSPSSSSSKTKLEYM
jgi:flagellar motility protein MotE (MotC chaperone)